MTSMKLSSTHDWSRPLIKPPALKSGDTVAVVSPSWGGPHLFPHRYEAGKRYLEEAFDLRVIEMPNALAAPDVLAEKPELRAQDLMRAFEDPGVSAVIASIGGDDAIRLIPHLDLQVIRANPKLFVGYSDATAIHFGLLKAGVGSLHGPTVMSGFAENTGMSSLSHQTFQAVAFDSKPMEQIPLNADGWTAQKLDWGDPKNQDIPRERQPSTGLQVLQGSGVDRGQLIGGCAEVLEMIKATPWWPPIDYWNNAIMFYETSEEAPSADHVKRWLRNYAAQGILQRLSGLVLGRPGGRMAENERASQKLAIIHAFQEAGLKDVPILADADIGHTDPIATLPYGCMAEINCDTAQLSILEPAVS